MYKVTYSTLNDTYTKTFETWVEANEFCNMIATLYPGQNPVIES